MLERIRPTQGLVNEVLDSLPAHVWQSSTTRFFDPAIGGGQFVSEIERRLRAHGHSDHNISTRVSGLEENEFLVDLARNMHQLVGNYTKCTYRDYFDSYAQTHDVIVCNPKIDNENVKLEGGKRNTGNKYWYQFVFASERLVTPGGYLAMVTPTQWLTGGVQLRRGSKGIIKDVFAKHQLVHARIGGVSEQYGFKSIQVGWWLLHATPTHTTTTLDLGTDTMRVDFRTTPFLSPRATAHSNSIVAKTLLGEGPRVSSYYFNSNTPKLTETEQPTTENKYAHWIMGSSRANNLTIRWFDRVINPRVGYAKIVFPMSTRYWQPELLSADTSVAALGQCIRVPDTTTQAGFESVYYSELFTYLCRCLQIDVNGFMKSVYIKHLPELDMSNAWTNEQLYTHFGITPEEQQYIKASI
jgi:hypothetical protein